MLQQQFTRFAANKKSRNYVPLKERRWFSGVLDTIYVFYSTSDTFADCPAFRFPKEKQFWLKTKQWQEIGLDAVFVDDQVLFKLPEHAKTKFAHLVFNNLAESHKAQRLVDKLVGG